VKFVFITRLGIGRRDDAFYRSHLRLCAMTIAASLRAQTAKDFLWVIAIDARAPIWVEAAIRKMASGIATEVWRWDPLVAKFNPIDRKRLQEIAGGEPIVTVRVDDDDLLHRSFVERVRKRFRTAAPNTFLTYSSGLLLSHRGVTTQRKAWIGLGLACLSDAGVETTAYQYSHSHTGKLATIDGHRVVEVYRADRPMWIRTIHSASDSSIRRADQPVPDATFVPRHYGLNILSLMLLRRMLRSGNGEPPPIATASGKPLPRLYMKMLLIRQIERIREEDPASEEIDALATAMYAL
jgi:hypothetical protein